MATDAHSTADDVLHLPRERVAGVHRLALVLAAAGVVLAIIVALFIQGGWRRFFLSYLLAYSFVLSISLAALFFVMLQHLTRAGWSVNVRRVPEALANLMPLLAVGALPLLFPVVFPTLSTADHSTEASAEGEEAHAEGIPTLWPWLAKAHDEHPGAGEAGSDVGHPAADATPREEHGIVEGLDVPPSGTQDLTTYAAEDDLPEESALTVERAYHHFHVDELTLSKSAYLNGWFFVIRLVIYFVVWIALAHFYWKNSVLQDATGDPALTAKMQKWAPLGMLALALTLTFAAFDLLMSLDPHWFSTIFGVYYFSGGVVGFFAVACLIYLAMTGRGYLRASVTTEHFHDLGKFLFAFVFFWGYIAFSQYMLYWGANIPETTSWLARRGATTVSDNLYWGSWPTDPQAPAGLAWWATVATAVLVGHLLIPFAGLMSRHVKRSRVLLGFWAGWMLFFHWVDLYWIIMPEMGPIRGPMGGFWQILPLTEVAITLAVIGAAAAYFLRNITSVSLRPTRDPRLAESLAFHNAF